MNERLDQEPITAQRVRPIDCTQTAREMAPAGRHVEKLLLARALQLVLNEHVLRHCTRAISFD